MDKNPYTLETHKAENQQPIGVVKNIFSEPDSLTFEFDLTTHGVFSFITSHHKWYNGIGGIYKYCSQQSGSALIKSYNAKTITHEKLVHLFKHFGYTLNTITWKKTEL